MANNNRRAGKLYVRVDGQLMESKGSFTTGMGLPQRTAIIGTHSVHGFYETEQVAFVEGMITDRSDLDLEVLAQADGVTVTVEFANGKTYVLSNAWFAANGEMTSEQAEVNVRWESARKGEWV